jgi:hypothetical protein
MNRPPAIEQFARSATGLADLGAEELARPDLGAALLALDRERGSDRRVARGTALPYLPAALRTRKRELCLVLEEVALRVPAAKTERHPVSEGPATLLLDPAPFPLGH